MCAHVGAVNADVHAEQVQRVGAVERVLPVQELDLAARGRARAAHHVALGFARRRFVGAAVAVRHAYPVVANAVDGAPLLAPLAANCRTLQNTKEPCFKFVDIFFSKIHYTLDFIGAMFL